MSKYFRVSVLSLISICALSVLNSGCEEEKKADEASTGPVAGPTPATCTGKVIFLTSVPNGNFGGAAGADTACANNKPAGHTGSTFKALLADDSRRPCYTGADSNCDSSGTVGRVDWILPASSNLCTTDAKLVGTTNANRFIDYIYPGVLSATATVTYTAMNNSWGQSSASNCSNFGSTAGTGRTGSAHLGMAGIISNGAAVSCATAGTIYCVEQ